MKRALYPGSFDPIHYGHMQIIERACNIFDEVVIAVLVNEDKYNSSDRLLTIRERYRLIKQLYKDNEKVKVVYSYKVGTVQIARKYNCNVIVRGLRDQSDFKMENIFNKVIHDDSDNEIEVVYLLAVDGYNINKSYIDTWAISSTVIRKKLREGNDLRAYCPQIVRDYISRKT